MLVLILYSSLMLSYILTFWSPVEGVVISVVYFVLAFALYFTAIKKLATTIEDKYIPEDGTTTSSSVVISISMAALLGMARLFKVETVFGV